MEKEDVPLILEWLNDPEFYGQYFSPIQRTRSDWERASESDPFEFKDFIIEKKDGTKVGFIAHCYALHPWAKIVEIGYGLVKNERGNSSGLVFFSRRRKFVGVFPNSVYSDGKDADIENAN